MGAADHDDADLDAGDTFGAVGAVDADTQHARGAGVRVPRPDDPGVPVGFARLAERPWTRWRERWVPAGNGVRVDPGRRGSAVISTVAVVAVVAASLGFFRTDGTVVGPSTVAVVDAGPGSMLPSGSGPAAGTIPTPESAGDAPAAGGSVLDGPVSPPPAAGPAPEIVVAVTGSVRQPGVVTLPGGARVADAVAAAGGFLDDTDFTGLNLAAKLVDGDSVVVGGPGQGLRSTVGPSSAAAGAGPPGVIDLNAADQPTLETLPGVGPVMAGNILSWRDTHGGFDSVEQLREVTGIGPARFSTLAPLVRAG